MANAISCFEIPASDRIFCVGILNLLQSILYFQFATYYNFNALPHWE